MAARPRQPEELAAQEALFPAAVALPRGRGREIDLAIAACALTLSARLSGTQAVGPPA